MTDPLVTVDWLAARLDEPNVKVVDATWFLPGDPRSPRGEYEAAHIPGAVFFDIEDIKDKASSLPHMLPAPEATAAAVGALGLNRGDTIVIYDAQGIFSGPRVWWHLRTAGFDKVFVLDGGLTLWRAAGHPVEQGGGTATAVQVAAQFDAALVADADQVRTHLEAGDVQIVDARAADRFRGDVPEIRPGLRSGHMPGALNTPWQQVIGPDGAMLPPDDLRAVFTEAGVDLDRPIITTCGSGVSAAILALAFARLGRLDVPVYDGSWTEWGGRNDLPVATGA
ncbi:3-mercaptopyruvate sulfurtransferase [Phenylobacterium immobile]|uniref:3-mercaptopyruvate sulfurtransferase n=1 Tax=Phenylobacterium immobile TaxID=21 RepID=UPI000AAFD7B8|nr:3-mercaptopyruvate sulfurtransferase [Phenylobacterium immobile]